MEDEELVMLMLLEARENDILSVDARPSDAINVANRCKLQLCVARTRTRTLELLLYNLSCLLFSGSS
nr:hypothetical protein CFP56_08213 [Quercus suber]